MAGHAAWPCHTGELAERGQVKRVDGIERGLAKTCAHYRFPWTSLAAGYDEAEDDSEGGDGASSQVSRGSLALEGASL